MESINHSETNRIMVLKNLITDIHALRNPEKIQIYQRFFKTAKGQYGEGDVFLGLTMPQLREVVKRYLKHAPLIKGELKGDFLSLEDINELLKNKHHEIRMAGVLVLVYFAQKKIYPLEEVARFYLEHSGFREIPPTPPLSRGQKLYQ